MSSGRWGLFYFFLSHLQCLLFYFLPYNAGLVLSLCEYKGENEYLFALLLLGSEYSVFATCLMLTSVFLNILI